MKSLLTAICIICFACGYIIGKSIFSSSKETQSASSAKARYDRSKSRDTRTRGNNRDDALLHSLLGGRSISEISAADLAAIFINLSKPGPNANDFSRAQQAYQFQLLLAKLSATNLADIATALSSDPETKNSSQLKEIVSTLARKDPARALDWISKQEDSTELYPVIISSIAENDSLTASSLFNTAMADGKITPAKLQFLINDIARSTAKLGADPFMNYLDTLPESLKIDRIRMSITNIPENDRIKFLDKILQRIQDGSLRKLNMDQLFSDAITKNNKAEATQWLNKLPDNEERNACRTAAAQSLYESGDRESAAEWMKEAIAAAPGREKEIIQRSIHDLRRSDPESVAFLANLLPEGIKFHAEDMNYSSIFRTEDVHVLASAFSDPNEKSIFIANSLNMFREIFATGSSLAMNSDDFAILSRQIAAMGFTGQNAARVNEAFAAAKNQLPLKN